MHYAGFHSWIRQPGFQRVKKILQAARLLEIRAGGYRSHLECIQNHNSKGSNHDRGIVNLTHPGGLYTGPNRLGSKHCLGSLVWCHLSVVLVRLVSMFGRTYLIRKQTSANCMKLIAKCHCSPSCFTLEDTNKYLNNLGPSMRLFRHNLSPGTLTDTNEGGNSSFKPRGAP